MGEVYKAKDTRLDRIVAIKVLPSHISSNTQARQRFEREARIAALHHPHICALFDVGQQDGMDFLVMEYLEGMTLAERTLQFALKFSYKSWDLVSIRRQPRRPTFPDAGFRSSSSGRSGDSDYGDPQLAGCI